jgi:hypothetical protein
MEANLALLSSLYQPQSFLSSSKKHAVSEKSFISPHPVASAGKGRSGN